jgi:hypothetical protein
MIEALFAQKPSDTFSTDELVEHVFRGVNRIEKKHRVAVLRAADNVAKRLGHWAKWKCERTFQHNMSGRGAIYANVLDVHSYAIGRLRTDFLYRDQSIAALETMLQTGDKARFIARGGAWWIHVEQHKAERGVAIDAETQAMIAVHNAGKEQWLESGKAMFGGAAPNHEIERRQRRRKANEHARICSKCGEAVAADDPIMRVPVIETRNFLGRETTFKVLETQCQRCGSEHKYQGVWYLEKSNCHTCGRKVSEPPRRDRLRTYCCEDCRRRPALVRRQTARPAMASDRRDEDFG